VVRIGLLFAFILFAVRMGIPEWLVILVIALGFFFLLVQVVFSK
jgi:hypothetical protein